MMLMYVLRFLSGGVVGFGVTSHLLGEIDATSALVYVMVAIFMRLWVMDEKP